MTTLPAASFADGALYDHASFGQSALPASASVSPDFGRPCAAAVAESRPSTNRLMAVLMGFLYRHDGAVARFVHARELFRGESFPAVTRGITYRTVPTVLHASRCGPRRCSARCACRACCERECADAAWPDRRACVHARCGLPHERRVRLRSAVARVLAAEHGGDRTDRKS